MYSVLLLSSECKIPKTWCSHWAVDSLDLLAVGSAARHKRPCRECSSNEQAKRIGGKVRKGLPAKDRHRDKLLRYLGNPEHDWPERSFLAKEVLGFKCVNSLWTVFPAEELCAIEREALDIRRTKYSKEIAKVDGGLLKAAQAGDARAAKLVYQRFENWTERSALDLNLNKHEDALAEIE